MKWPWSNVQQSDEVLKKKDREVARVRVEVLDLVQDMKDVLSRIESRADAGGAGGRRLSGNDR